MNFTGKFYAIFTETPILVKLFYKTAEGGMFPNLFYEATIILIPKPHKDKTKKENYRSISLMNTTKNSRQSISKENILN